MNPSRVPADADSWLTTLMRALECVESAERSAAVGDRDRALQLYGAALDDFVREGFYDLAASTARQMLDRYPGVVRARGTLAVLTLARGLRKLSRELLEASRRDFDLYLGAARAAGQAQAAVWYLRTVAEKANDVEVRAWLAEFLESLEDAAPRSEEGESIGGEATAAFGEPPLLDPAAGEPWIEILCTPAPATGEGGELAAAGPAPAAAPPAHAPATASAKAPAAVADPLELRSKESFGPDAPDAATELCARVLRREHAARRKAEQEARRSAEAIRILAHDLRNPLNAIRLNLESAQEASSPGEATRREVARALAILSRTDQLLQSFLDASRWEAGKGVPLERTRLEVGAVLREACSLFDAQIRSKRLEVECVSPPACPAIWADGDRLLQVFWNLLGNAVKFTPAGGRVTLRAELLEGKVCFSVSDSEPGIPGEQGARIFDPYWQEKRTTRLGTGLGLPISRAIIEAHGGTIWVGRPGPGATFSFTIPLVD